MLQGKEQALRLTLEEVATLTEAKGTLVKEQARLREENKELQRKLDRMEGKKVH